MKKIFMLVLLFVGFSSYAESETPCPLDVVARGAYKIAVLQNRKLIESKGYSIASMKRYFDYTRNIRLEAEAYTEQPGGKLGVMVNLVVTRNYERRLFADTHKGNRYLKSKNSTVTESLNRLPTCEELRNQYPDLYL
jgi:hypothetical protein